MYKLFEGLERRLHLKLDQMHADIKTALEAIQQSASQPSTSTSASDLTEVLEEPCKTVEELEDLCKMLKVVDFRKKTVCLETYHTMLFYIMQCTSRHCALITDYCCCL